MGILFLHMKAIQTFCWIAKKTFSSVLIKKWIENVLCPEIRFSLLPAILHMSSTEYNVMN